MKGAGVHDRLTHEADAHLIATSVLDGEAHARPERHVRADDAVTTKEIHVAVEEMHGATLAACDTVGASKQLGHHITRRYAARDRLTVIAVRGDDVIVRPQDRERAGADGLLPDVEMAEPADLAERVRFGAALLEAALQEHRTQQLAVEVGIGLSVS